MTAGLLLYNLLAALVFIVCWPFLLAACLAGAGGKWRGRCGLVPKRSDVPVWIHAASVGEVNAIAPLTTELRARRPERAIVLSTMTETGQLRARELLGPAGEVFFFPADFAWAQAAALRRLSPALVVLVETELWPNLLWQCHQRKIPVVLVNARLSARSLPHYRRAAFLFRPLLDTVRAIACQSEEDARRYRSLGVRPEVVRVLGNMKYDGIKGPVSSDEKRNLRREFGIPDGAVVLTAGSTREGEEILLLDAWAAVMQNVKYGMHNARLIVAPRHPARFAEVESLLKERAVRYTTRSQQRKARGPAAAGVLLLDTIGELVDAYAAADVAFVGGSLVPVGGHNPLEPAALGLPVVFGPHMFNAQESADGLVTAGGAVPVNSAGALAAVLCAWLGNPQERARIGKCAAQVVDEKRGAMRRTVELIEAMLA